MIKSQASPNDLRGTSPLRRIVESLSRSEGRVSILRSPDWRLSLPRTSETWLLTTRR